MRSPDVCRLIRVGRGDAAFKQTLIVCDVTSVWDEEKAKEAEEERGGASGSGRGHRDATLMM